MAKMDAQQTTSDRHIYRYVFICSGLLFALIILFSGIGPAVYANEVKQGGTVTIVTPGTEARLCPLPGCGPDQHITRIPAGTVLKVESAQDYAIGTFTVKWFEVVYQNQHGWISIYDTDQTKK
jgi:hypothetical protein